MASTVSSADTFDTIRCGTKRVKQIRSKLFFLTLFSLLLTLVLLINVHIGSLAPKKLIRDWYFLNLDLTYLHVEELPEWLPEMPVNRLLGLHDFYRVGLWSYCAGYNDHGVVYCSSPQPNFWFNPVKVLESELLIGSSCA